MKLQKHERCKHWNKSAIARWSLFWCEGRKKGQRGWVYAMGCKAQGLEDIIKLGGTGQCPLCRVEEYCPNGFTEVNGMELLALAPADDWRAEEQLLLAKAGKPCRGKEWFDSKQSRLGWMLSEGCFLSVQDSERSCQKLVEQFLQI